MQRKKKNPKGSCTISVFSCFESPFFSFFGPWPRASVVLERLSAPWIVHQTTLSGSVETNFLGNALGIEKRSTRWGYIWWRERQCDFFCLVQRCLCVGFGCTWIPKAGHDRVIVHPAAPLPSLRGVRYDLLRLLRKCYCNSSTFLSASLFFSVSVLGA